MEIEAIFSMLCKSLKHKVMISDGVQASCRRLIGLHCQFAWSDMLAATCAMFADSLTGLVRCCSTPVLVYARDADIRGPTVQVL